VPQSAAAHRRTGRLTEAEGPYRQMLNITSHLDELFQGARQHHNNGRLVEAERIYRQILRQNPRHADALLMLGVLAAQLQHHDAAVEWLRQSIAVKPDSAPAHNNLGNILATTGRYDQAIAEFQQAIAYSPNAIEPQMNLAIALMDKGDLGGAVAACRHILAAHPDFVRAHVLLSKVLRQMGDTDAAVEAAIHALALNANDVDAQISLGNALADLGQAEEAIAAYRKARLISPASGDAHRNLIFSLHYSPACTPQVIAEEHRQWGRQYAAPLKKFIQPHANDRSPDRRLRIGYVSPDFYDHAVAPMVLPLIEHHDRTQFEVFCYSQVRRPDAWTDKFCRLADQWRSIVGLSDPQLADLIRQDGIDISLTWRAILTAIDCWRSPKNPHPYR
jgi:protein O-GlcNAc transferase